MTVSRLTDELLPARPDTFCFCRSCGYTSTEIVEFQMWQECVEGDHKPAPEPYNVFTICYSKNVPESQREQARKCERRIEDSPRGYNLIPWGEGQPGYLMLLCGDCKNRSGYRCQDVRAKANGGPGLLCQLGGLTAMNIHVCSYDDIAGDPAGEMHETSHFIVPHPVSTCEGYAKQQDARQTKV